MPSQPLPAVDLAEIADKARDAFATLRDANLFITGGTGFFGHWLLESLLAANRICSLNAKVTLLTRDPRRFTASSPHIALDPAITLLNGDMCAFPFPVGSFSHIVHAAAETGSNPAATSTPLRTIVSGTGRLLEFASQQPATRILFVSTGAVYGRSTPLLNTAETYLEDVLPALAPGTYEAAKREAESLCLASRLDIVIARCFAFVGPRLPLDAHFAMGNFIADAMANRPVTIMGDGSPRRSWMYMSDLAIWLWTLLAVGETGQAYNVGSPVGHTIAEAASIVAEVLQPSVRINRVARSPAPPLNSYVPSIDRAQQLGLTIRVPLRQAITRTAAWYGFIPRHAEPD